MNLESLLRITAKVTGLDSLRKLSKGVGDAEKAARKAEKRFKQMLDSRLFRTAAVAAAGLTAAIGLSAKAAIDFESSMADVRKVVEGLDTPKAFAEINQEILDLSKQMPITAKGFAEIYAAAGQAGIARDDLKEFAIQVGQVAVAFDMTADEAGTAMAKLQTSLGLSLPELRDLTDAMNHLSNNTASSASEIVDFTLRAGQAGKSAGLTAEQTSAFGAAMIASGSSAEVAATSFRNMIKALSRGPSMTERQLDALTKLGYKQSDAAVNEKTYTEAVRRESDARIAAARHETNQLAKELNRRFRDQMQSIQDNFDDEAEAYEEGVQDRVNAQVKGLQREQEARISQLRENSQQNGANVTQQINAIRDEYDARIDAIRDNARDELKARRRFDRDRLQEIRDNMDDQKETELAALESKFQETEAKEKQLMESKVAEIQAQAKAGATAAAEALAKGLQEDAIGTITDVFDRIKQLPKEAQLSVVSDLFGDEARAILPLINNTALLEKAMGLVGDKSEYAGSTLQEFLTRSKTTANEIKKAQGNLQTLSITFGQMFAPALNGLLQVLTPVIKGFTWMVQNIPGLGPALAILTTAFVALVAVLPALGALVQIFATFGGVSATFTAIGTAIGGIIGSLTGGGGLLAAIVAVFSGPVGWIALLVAAGIAIYTFRDQIGAAIGAVVNFFKGLGQTIMQELALIGQLFMQLPQTINDNFIQPAIELFTTWSQFVGETFTGALQLMNDTFVQPALQAWQGFTQSIQGIIQGIYNFIVNNFIQPAMEAWQSFVGGIGEALQKIPQAASDAMKSAYDFVVNTFIRPAQQAFSTAVGAIAGAFRNVYQAITGPIQQAYNVVVNIVKGIINAVNSAISGIARMIGMGGGGVRAAAEGAYWAGGFTPFAEGGMVKGPTLGLVGEAGPEYIVPAHKATRFAENILAGVRGPAAIPRFAEGGFVSPSANVSIQTGPVTQMNGTNYVTTQDLSRAVQSGVNQTLSMIAGDGRVRRQLGLA